MINFYYKILTKVTLLTVAFIPSLAFADSYLVLEQPKTLTDVVNNFMTILNGDLSRGVFGIIPFIMGFCFFGFFVGVLKYVNAGGDEERMGKAKQLIVYGLIGLVIAFTFWGLAALVARTYFQI